MLLPPELFPESISQKQIIFMAMTVSFLIVSIPMILRFYWMENLCIYGLLFMVINPIDITLFSYTNYRGDIRGIEFGVTDWFSITLIANFYFGRKYRNLKLRYTSPNSFFLWAYFAICAQSIFTAYVPQFAFFGLTRVIRAYLIFWIGLNYVRSNENIQTLFNAMVAITLFSFYQVLADKYIRGIFPPRGVFPHQNSLSTFQNTINFFLFAYVLAYSKKMFDRRNLLYLVALGGGTLTNLATLSRGGLATMFMVYAMIFVLVSLLKLPAQKKKKKWKVLSLGLLFGIPLLGFLLPPIIHRFKNAPKESGEARDLFNEVSHMMGNEAFFGVGFNNYSFMGITKYREFFPNIDQGGLAHHIYWLHYAELGILGPILWSGLILSFIWVAMRQVLSRKNTLEAIYACGAVGGFIGAMLIGLLEWNFRQTSIHMTYFLLAGTIAGVSLTRAQHRKLQKNL